MNEKKFLVKFEDNWADEMDINSHLVMSESEVEAYKKLVRESEYPFELFVGTNQNIDYDSAEEFLACLTFIEVSEEDVLVLEKLDLLEVGDFPTEDYFEEDDLGDYL